MARAAGCCSSRPQLSLLTVSFETAAIGKGAASDWSSIQVRGSAIGTGGLKRLLSDDLVRISLSWMPPILPKRRYSYSRSMSQSPQSFHREISLDILKLIMPRMAQMGNLLRFQLSSVLFIRGTSDEQFHSLGPASRIQKSDSIWTHKLSSADAVG